MEYHNDRICVTHDDLIGGEEPVIKTGTLNSLHSRKQIQVIHRGGGEGNCALILYSSLPKKYRTRFEALKGDPETLLKQQMMNSHITTDEAARQFYEDYRYDMGGEETPLSEKLKAEYTLNASVLSTLIRDMDRRAARSRALGNKRTDLWDILLAECEQYRQLYGHTLPTSLARLKSKMRDFRRDSYAALVSGKLGNTSTLKITPEAGEWLIARKRSRTPVYTNAQILAEYNREAPVRGWKQLKSLRSLTQWLGRPEVEPLWWDAVHGELAAHQRYSRKHRTQLPARRDSLWYGDGTKLNLYYRDEQGHVCTTMVYEVVDAYSEVLLGYYISDRENFEAQYHAYRMAVQVAAHKPYEIVHDNQGGHKKLETRRGTSPDGAGFLDRICRVHRTTAPYSGQSKTIESIFGRFQAQELHRDWRFTGMNITARRADSRPNLEFIAANRDKLFTLAELREHYADARRAWNAAPHPATGIPRIEMYNRSVNEETDAVTPADMVDLFWIWAKKPVTFTPSGIEVTIGTITRPYEVFAAPGKPDHEWRRRNTYRKFHVRYDPNDLRSVRLYREDRAGELRFERVAEFYLPVHRALQDQTEGEAAFIRQEQEANLRDRIERQVIVKEIEYAYGVAPEQNGLVTPPLKGIPADAQREIDRRTRKYSLDVAELEPGRVSKRTSNLTLDQLDGEVSFDERRAAGKL